MLVRHPTIYLSADGDKTDALLVRDGVVVATGREAIDSADHTDTSLEPDGACVFGALTDAHVHLWGLGLRQGSVSLGGTDSTAEVYALLRHYDLGDAPGGWVLGRDWDQHRWRDADALDIDRLDDLFGHHPLVLRRVDGHALWVNSAALRRAGISPDWNPGPNGHVGRRADGSPSGLLVDDAMNPVLEAIPEPTPAEDRAVFLDSCERLRSHGIAGAHIAWMPLDRMKMLTDLHRDGELPLRLHLFLDGRDDNLGVELERGPRFDDWLNVSGVKFFADGALGSHGAHLCDGYADGTEGLVLEEPAHLAARCQSLAAAGWQIAVHAIGDAAARNVLNAFAAIDPADRAATRPRMEHAQMVGEDDVRRFSELGVIASIQPIHMYSDAAWADDELSPSQLARLFPWRALADHAPSLAGGSDYPIEDPNPWHAIATAVTRRDRRGRPFNEDQALARSEILSAYTAGAAFAAHREQRFGRLAPGFAADFAALSHDPFECSESELWDISSQGVWIGERSIQSEGLLIRSPIRDVDSSNHAGGDDG